MYSHIRGWDSFGPWLTLNRKPSLKKSFDLASEVPPDWYGAQWNEMEKLVKTSIERRSMVRELIVAFGTAAQAVSGVERGCVRWHCVDGSATTRAVRAPLHAQCSARVVNFGVILVKESNEVAGFRFTHDWPRIRCCNPNADIEALQAMQRHLEEDLAHTFMDGESSNLLHIHLKRVRTGTSRRSALRTT